MISVSDFEQLEFEVSVVESCLTLLRVSDPEFDRDVILSTLRSAAFNLEAIASKLE